jgi:hypothetical protein
MQYRDRAVRAWVVVEHGSIWVYGWCHQMSFRVVNDGEVIVE